MPYRSFDDFVYNPEPPKPKGKWDTQRWVGVLEREIERLTGIGQEDCHAGVELAFHELLLTKEPELARLLVTFLTRNPKTKAWELFKRVSRGSFRPELSFSSCLESMVAQSSDRSIVDLILDVLVNPKNFEVWQLDKLIFFVHRKPDPRAVDPLVVALENEQTRGEAVRALGEIKDRRATLPLIEYLDDFYSRAAIMESLGNIGDKRAIQPLIPYLNDEDKAVREVTRFTLFRLGYVRPLDDLRRQLQSENVEEQVEAIHGLARSNNPDAVELIIGAASDKSTAVRDKAVESLVQLKDARAFDAFISALSDEYLPIQADAIEGLGYLGDKRAVDLLIKMLKTHPYPEFVASALGCLGDDRAVKPLIECLKHERKNVRTSAIGALGNIGDKTAIEALVPLLKDEHTYRAAHRALTQLGYQFES